MRISDRHISKQIITGTLFTVVLLSVVLVLGNLFREIRPLLVDQSAPLSMVLRFVLRILPFSLMYTIPWGFLAAVMLVFGRMSSDNELHGLRMAGIGLTRLSMPVFVIAGLLSGLCLWMNVSLAPHSSADIDQMLFEIIRRDPKTLLNPGAVQGRFREGKVFVERKVGDELHGFHLYQTGNPSSKEPQPSSYVHAARVALVVDNAKQQLRLKLDDAYIETLNPDGTIDLAIASEAEPWLFDYGAAQARKYRPRRMDNREIRDYLASGKITSQKIRNEFQAEVTRRYSFSLACLSLAFVGIPLGITARRKDTSSGLALSLLIGGGYFIGMIFASQKYTASDTPRDILLWAPNVACVLLGLWLFRRRRFG